MHKPKDSSPPGMPNTWKPAPGLFSLFLPALISASGWILAMVVDYFVYGLWPGSGVRVLFYVLIYLPVGLPVLASAFRHATKGQIFSEFTLMSLATLGAFALQEFAEAVAVMLFYTVGENLQSLALRRAKSHISGLMDQRPDQVTLIHKEGNRRVPARDLKPGDRVLAQPGERLALDGELISDSGRFDTRSLTGESRPMKGQKGDVVLAGMVNLRHPVEVEVSAAYEDSRLSQILDLTEKASLHKAPTEIFIRRFARYYTPAVVGLALAICLIPYFWADPYIFQDWLYRALVFLVISCPCALVIAIPLGYVGGLGAASRQGILFKGSAYLDRMSRIRHIVWDKTGTLTEGELEVQEVFLTPGLDPGEYLPWVSALEKNSRHPIALALVRLGESLPPPPQDPRSPVEWEGRGIEGEVNGQILRVGNFRWLDQLSIPYPREHSMTPATTVALALGDQYLGYIRLGDRIRPEAAQVIGDLRKAGIESSILSGDQETAVRHLAERLGISRFHGGLLPDEKVRQMEKIKARDGLSAFVGDGINDGPVLAWSDLGIAMGKGADLAMEAADLIIDGSRLDKIPQAITIGRRTRDTVWQNLFLAFVVKLLVLTLGAFGLASLWEAVFADVGVALLAIANALRIQKISLKVKTPEPGNREP